jgi:hypothetical protein
MVDYPKVLFVEGNQEIRIIPELMKRNGVTWEVNNEPVVYIRGNEGYKSLVKPDVITTELNASGLSALGIIIDADNNPLGRWASIRNASLHSIPDIPKLLPEEGLIHTTSEGIKFGIWIMPDNKTEGMLETFLAYLISSEKEELWQFAQEVTQEAKSKGAAFKDVHSDKANIYTWLAWQNPPGLQLHQSVMKKSILNPQHPNAQKFVTWFKNLYDLT